MQGKVFIIFGVRGSGKTHFLYTLLNRLSCLIKKENLTPVYVPHYVSRQKRQGEIQGFNFFPMTKEQMSLYKSNFEYIIKYPNKDYYCALPKLQYYLNNGKDVIIIIRTIERIKHLMKKYDCHIIYIESKVSSIENAMKERKYNDSKIDTDEIKTELEQNLDFLISKRKKGTKIYWVANDTITNHNRKLDYYLFRDNIIKQSAEFIAKDILNQNKR